MSKSLKIYIDGAAKGNPGPASIGVVVYKDNKIVKEISQSIGDTTNNVAEYTALIYALQESLLQKARVSHRGRSMSFPKALFHSGYILIRRKHARTLSLPFTSTGTMTGNTG